MARIYLIAPVFNESGNISRLLDGWRSLLTALSPQSVSAILVDDGSVDTTVDEIRQHQGEMELTLLCHERNMGPGHAFGTAFASLADQVADDDLVITLEGDNTSAIDILKIMIERCRRENLDVVLASPHSYGGGFSNTSSHRVLLSHFASAFVRGLLGLHGINTTSSFFRVHTGSALRRLQERYGPRIVERDGFEGIVELLIKCTRLKLTISEVASFVDTSQRAGKSKMRVFRTIRGYFALLLASRRW